MILVYTYTIIRLYVLKGSATEQNPLAYGAPSTIDDSSDNETNSETEFNFSYGQFTDIFSYFYGIFRIILLMCSAEILFKRKASTLAILKK